MSDKGMMIIDNLVKKIEGYKPDNGESHAGQIIEVGDGIARIAGLADVKYH